jgi:hypothetical protein
MYGARCRPAGETNSNQIGTLDDASALSGLKPAIELFAPTRIPWVQAVDGAQQKDAM